MRRLLITLAILAAILLIGPGIAEMRAGVIIDNAMGHLPEIGAEAEEGNEGDEEDPETECDYTSDASGCS